MVLGTAYIGAGLCEVNHTSPGTRGQNPLWDALEDCLISQAPTRNVFQRRAAHAPPNLTVPIILETG